MCCRMSRPATTAAQYALLPPGKAAVARPGREALLLDRQSEQNARHDGKSDSERAFAEGFAAAVDRVVVVIKVCPTAENIFVVTTSTSFCYDWLSHEQDFAGLDKVDYAGDPDKVSTYTLGTWEQISAQDDGYAFYSDGGFSWLAPYLAGLYALACQVKLDVTPEEFWKTALGASDKLTVPIQTEKTARQGKTARRSPFGR